MARVISALRRRCDLSTVLKVLYNRGRWGESYKFLKRLMMACLNVPIQLHAPRDLREDR
ncbi:MAG: hypothetical protein RMJ00_03975 [Nitrososphaerota archaeon]|nr:hypothetical protein [Nitrososphaerota archaeon]